MSVKSKIDNARSKYPDIMDKINKKLVSSGITITTSQKETLIRDVSKRTILEVIYSLPIDAEDLFILVDVISAKGIIHIIPKNCI
jgi:hypothetical protein